MITRFRRIILASWCLLSPAYTLADPAVSWGADFTSNYVFDGLTQSDSGFAFQPWVEVENRGFYAAAWASTVDLGTDNWEIDLLLGYRKTHANGLFWEVGYAQYYYDDTGNCCGEIKFTLAYPVLERLTLEGYVAVNPENENVNRSATAYIDITDQANLSGRIGKSDGSGTEYWDVGGSWRFNETVSADVRYYGADAGDEGVVVTMSLGF